MLGSVIDRAAVRRLAEPVDDAIPSGTQLLAGSTADGPCFALAVLKGVTPAMRRRRQTFMDVQWQ